MQDLAGQGNQHAGRQAAEQPCCNESRQRRGGSYETNRCQRPSAQTGMDDQVGVPVSLHKEPPAWTDAMVRIVLIAVRPPAATIDRPACTK